MTKIDPDTGLPELPEKYFWRVRPSGRKYGYLELRKKFFLGSVVEKDTIFERSTVTESRILHDALGILAKHNFAGDPSKKFFGTYPPKKLGA